MMRAILAGKDDDAERVLPEYMRPKLRAMRDGLREYLEHLDRWYDAAPKADRKTLAMAVNAAGEWMPVHMARLTGKAHDAGAFLQILKRDGDWTDGTVDFLLSKAAAQ